MTRQITLTDKEFVETRDAILYQIENAQEVLTDLRREGTREEIRDQQRYLALLRRILEKLRETADPR